MGDSTVVYEAAAVFEIFSESISTAVVQSQNVMQSFSQTVEIHESFSSSTGPISAFATTASDVDDNHTTTTHISTTETFDWHTTEQTSYEFEHVLNLTTVLGEESWSTILSNETTHNIIESTEPSTSYATDHDSNVPMTTTTSSANEELAPTTSIVVNTTSWYTTSDTTMAMATTTSLPRSPFLKLNIQLFVNTFVAPPVVVSNITALNVSNEENPPSEPPATCKLVPVQKNQSSNNTTTVTLPDFCMDISSNFQCQLCIQGFMVSEENNSCVRCPAGKYRGPADNARECIPCEAGKSTLGLGGQSKCYLCKVNESTNGMPGQATCSNCTAVGGFSNRTGSPFCLCVRGTSLDFRGSKCIPCLPGYLDAGSVSEPIILVNETTQAYRYGYPNVFMPQQCQLCPAGMYSTKAGALTCARCEAGKYISHALRGATECTLCPLHTYSNESSTKWGCSQCYAHGYTLGLGSSGPCLCGPGYVFVTRALASPNQNNETYYHECEGCPAGKFEAYTDWCEECDVGEYAAGSGNTACSLCKLGTYSDILGQTSASCFPCSPLDPEGLSMSTDREGTYEIGDCFCRPGYSISLSLDMPCDACAPGKYARTKNLRSCTDCARGTYSSATARTSICDGCEIGFYNPILSQTACLSCSDIGMSNATLAKSSINYTQCICMPGSSRSFDFKLCVPCHPGSSNPISNGVCRACTEGKYASGSGFSQCENCSMGFFNPDVGKTACRSCSLDVMHGTSTSTTGSRSPEDCLCPEGMAFNETTFHCDFCRAGTYKPFMNGSQCILCDKGMYSSVIGSTSNASCQACPLGKYNPSLGQAQCIECDHQGLALTSSLGSQRQSDCICGKGKTWDYLMTTCVECLNGTYQPNVNGSQCIPCDKGMYSSLIGSTSNASCQACPLGKYNPSLGQAQCIECDLHGLGTTPNMGSQNQSDCFCGKGNAWDYLRIRCAPCIVGMYQSEDAGERCLPCEQGTYSNASAWSQRCLACPLGKYNPNEGQVQCQACDTRDMAYTLQQGSVRFEDCVCTAGYIWDRVSYDSPQCIECEPGTYQPYANASHCESCAPGFFSSEIGLSSASQCKLCAAGSFSVGYNPTACALCPPNTSTHVKLGSSACAPCSPYSEALAEGSPSCTCVDGAVSTNDSNCALCALGTYFHLNASDRYCLECEPGKYSNRTGTLHACNDCEQDTYTLQHAFGSTSCAACTLHSGTRNQTRSTKCWCNPGFALDFSGSICAPCLSGYYSWHSIEDLEYKCTACFPGTYSDSIHSSACTRCPDGFYSEKVTGSTGCLECANHSVPTHSQTSCICPPIYYNHTLFENSTALWWSCEPCTIGCPSDHFLHSACTETQDTVCLPCSKNCSIPNQYIWRNCSSTRDIDCRPCSGLCGRDFFVTKECSAFENIKCERCTSRCPTPLHYVKKACSSLRGDLECELCSSGTFPDIDVALQRCINCPLGHITMPMNWSSQPQKPCILCSAEPPSPDLVYTSADKSSCVSQCRPGEYLSKGSTTTSMIDYWFCEYCPIGTFGIDGVSCQNCDPFESCGQSQGMTACIPCSREDSLLAAQLPSGILPEDVCLV